MGISELEATQTHGLSVAALALTAVYVGSFALALFLMTAIGVFTPLLNRRVRNLDSELPTRCGKRIMH